MNSTNRLSLYPSRTGREIRSTGQIPVDEGVNVEFDFVEAILSVYVSITNKHGFIASASLVVPRCQSLGI